MTIVCGPTGVGKTYIAVELANQLGGEIVCGDAFQFYRGMEILTAQPAAEQRRTVAHHLFGSRDPAEPFDAATFRLAAMAACADIQARGRVPIVVGGAGMYLKVLTHGLAERPPSDPAVRARLEAMTDEARLARLGQLDPASTARIDTRNPRRVLRALEICEQTGRPASELPDTWSAPLPGGMRGVVLTRPRADLHARIEANVNAMFLAGVIEEVRALGPLGITARKTLGLTDVFDLIHGRISLADCRARIAASTRRYAKRQLTWFRHQFTFPTIDLSLHSIIPDAVAEVRRVLGDQR